MHPYREASGVEPRLSTYYFPFLGLSSDSTQGRSLWMLFFLPPFHHCIPILLLHLCTFLLQDTDRPFVRCNPRHTCRPTRSQISMLRRRSRPFIDKTAGLTVTQISL